MTTGRSPVIVIPALVLALVGIGGCEPGRSGPEAGEEEIRQAVRTMLEDGWSRGQMEAFRSTMADSVVFHYHSAPARILTREDSDALIRAWREAFPDLRMELEELVVEGDMAAARATLTGTHQGPWAGAEPTGEGVSMSLMMFMRFEDGRMVELWEADDQMGFQRQLGILP